MQHKRVILPHCWWLLGNMMILYVIQLWWRCYCHEIKIIQCFLEGVAGAQVPKTGQFRPLLSVCWWDEPVCQLSAEFLHVQGMKGKTAVSVTTT